MANTTSAGKNMFATPIQPGNLEVDEVSVNLNPHAQAVNFNESNANMEFGHTMNNSAFSNFNTPQEGSTQMYAALH